MSNPAEATSRVSPKTVEKAVNALLQWRNTKTKTVKPQLLEQDEFIYLILTLKKIPANSRTNPHKISLPRPLVRPQTDNTQLCLIIDDRSKSQLTKEDAQKKIKNEDIPISKVLKLSKLKTDYRPFEAKRKLCDSYDMFFADKRVIPLLPKLLGKQFFKKKKIPVPVDLKHKNWKEQIERSCGSALLYLRTGTCSVIKVGKVSMTKEEIVENVVDAIGGIAEIVPRKWGNVRSFHLKMLESLALPVYQAVPDMKLRIESGIGKEEEGKEEAGKESEVKKDEKVGKKKKKTKKKGRIHEVRYMDSNIGEVFGEDELGGDSEGEIGGENEEMGSAEIGGKKRKKGDKVKGEKQVKKVKKDDKLKGEKQVKKVNNDGLSAKVKNEDRVKQKKQEKEGMSVKGGGKPRGKRGKQVAFAQMLSAEEKVKDKKRKKNQVAE